MPCPMFKYKPSWLTVHIATSLLSILQIYSGYMQRKFVPVEERGTGQHDSNINAPLQLRNDNPHTDHHDAGKGTANGNGQGEF